MKDKKHGRKAIINRILTVAFLFVFLFSLYKIVNIFLEYRNIDKLYDDTVTQYTSDEHKTDTDPIEVDLKQLQAVNDDVIGWIYIPETNINFPVLQGKNNKQYLFQSYEKEYLTAGSIFIDYRCAEDFTDKNTVIYGHNMHNGSMFGKLKKYKDEKYKKTHSCVYILNSAKEWNQYEIIACFQADVEGAVYDLPIDEKCSEEKFKQLRTTIKAENIYSGDVKITKEDHLITLSTCTQDSRNDVRVVVISKLI